VPGQSLKHPRFGITGTSGREGDETLNSICSALYPEVLAAVRKELAPDMRSRLDASDIVQAIFREVVAFARRVPDAKHFKRLLLGKARRHLLSLGRYHRAKKRALDREVSLTDLEVASGALIHPVDHSPSPADAAIGEELSRLLNQALDQLPAGEREVLQLYQCGLGYDEIAQRSGRSPETVRRAYWRAIEHLRQRLSTLDERAPEAHKPSTIPTPTKN
jgi:RNA polymerase sigma factor (sigma-70 family)